MSGAPARALIVRMSSIGDVVHTMPAFMALRRAWPQTRFGWAIERAAADLLAHIDDLDVHLLDVQAWRRSPLRPRTWRQIRAARAALRHRRYDVAIDFQGLLKSAVVARTAAATTLGFDRADCREPLAARLYERTAARLPDGLHIIHRNLHVAAAAIGTAGDGTIEWPTLTGRAEEERVNAELARLGIERPILVHAAASWESKHYPVRRYVEAAGRLHAETGLPILWVWGPGEEKEARRLAQAAGKGNRVAFPTRLPELCALLRRAALHIGGDSAPLHLAVACGTPTVAVFGPTDPGRTGPLDAADGVVVRRLECSHCHRRRCPLGTTECLESIPASEIVAAALRRLNGADSVRGDGCG